jgi:maspardin
MYENLFFP